MLFTFFTHVAKVERRSRVVRATKEASGQISTVEEDLGYFLILEGLGVGISIGHQDPKLEPGQKMKLTVERF